ncbi:MAG: 4-(cytidine 5'-diphospho)-2-C-methyl-D-erythritol kinase [Bacteroidales bacterium]|nr:4-(cytidine 5'-diphospho)-2-C-methyl-D-erythritol kinase [Bacteroidales bacterium]
MILFSPAKINIGLRIIERRKDGFHNLQSVMFPLGLCDILEIRKSVDQESGIQFSQSGIQLESGTGKNLCIKAYELLNAEILLPPVNLHLHKQIPVGAGLGGGSSNAGIALRGLNSISPDPLSHERLLELAGRLGSDCPFFLFDRPMMMEGRGEILSPFALDTDQLYLVLLFPEIHISTKDAYGGVIPEVPGKHLQELIIQPMHQWKHQVINDFESSVFKKYPELGSLKAQLYQAGAVYASLSGSGSALFGLFSDQPRLTGNLARYVIWEGRANRNDPI